jgi:phage protein D
MTKPWFQVWADGADFTDAVQKGLITLTVTDVAGEESDTVSIAVAVGNNKIQPPRKGALIKVAMGWQDGPRAKMGTFTADTPKVAGFPTKVSITGRAADQRETLKQHRVQGWDDKTIGEIAEEIAGRNGLSPAVAGELASKRVPFIAQSEESDQHFLRRLAARHGAIATVKEGRLIVVKRGAGKSAGGASVPPVVIVGTGRIEAFSCTTPDRPAFKSVVATWADRENARRPEVSVPAGDTGCDYVIRQPFASGSEAKDAADAKAADLKRSTGSLSLTLIGDPTIRAEAPLSVSGLYPGADGQWTIQKATHSISGDGFTTDIAADKGEGGEA